MKTSIIFLIVLLSGLSAQTKTEKQPKVVIPVVFHILHGNGIENITDDQLISCIDKMNEDFNGKNAEYKDVIPEFADIKAKIGFTFALAKFDPDGKPSSGINRVYDPSMTVQINGQDLPMKEKYQWPSDQYFNVYVLRSAGIEYGSAWAYDVSFGNPKLDGVTVSYWSVGRTRIATPTHYYNMTHETGHYFSLAHTFQGGCDTTRNGDGVDDTPPTTQGSASNLSYKPCGVLTNTQNFMNYSSLAGMFTKGQKVKMWKQVTDTTGGRTNLWSEENLVKTGVKGIPVRAEFYAHQLMTVPGNSITFHDISFVESEEIISWEWTFEGGIPSTFKGKTPPAVRYDKEGTFDVSLTVKTKSGKTNTTLKSKEVRATTEIFMQNADFKVSNGTFYDHALDGRYGVRTDATLTLRPNSENSSITAAFVDFMMETDSTDYLDIYDGESTRDNYLGRFSGSNSPGYIKSTHKSGALTFVVHTNSTYRFRGWEAKIVEVTNSTQKPVAEFEVLNSLVSEDEYVTFNDYSKGVPTSWKWSFEGADVETSTKQNPRIQYDDCGVYSVTLEVKNAQGKSSITKKDVVVVGMGTKLPYKNDFSGFFPPITWSIINPDRKNKWIRKEVFGNSVLVMNNTNNSKVGEADGIIVEPVNLDDLESATLTFDLAYTKFDKKSPDVLNVLVSTDGGESWDNVYSKNHLKLETLGAKPNPKDTIPFDPEATASDDPNGWIPSAPDHWRTETIDLENFTGEEEVFIKFQNISGYGTRIWIDNLVIDGKK